MNGFKLLLLLLGLLVAITIAGWSELEWIVYSGLALLAIAWFWSRASLIGVGFSRTLDGDRVFAGSEVRERFRVSNRSLFPRTWIDVRDRSTLPGHASVRSVGVRGRSETRWTATTTAQQRGRYRLGPVELRSGDPFGLFVLRKSLDLTHELLVYPKLVPLPEAARTGGVLTGATQIAPGRSASSPVIRSLRQYVTGDPWNHIAWRASARYGSFLVKELEPDPIADEWILLDLAPRAGRERKVTEHAVSLAASFAVERLDAARDVGLLVNRRIPAVVDADAGDRQRLRILETLAVVEPYGEADPAVLVSRFANRFSRSTSIVVISTATGDLLVKPLRHLVERGIPVLVIAMGTALPGDQGAWSAVESLGVTMVRYAVDGTAIPPQDVHRARYTASTA